MASETVDLRPKVCSTCNKPRTWDTPSCPYCSGNSGKSVTELVDDIPEVEKPYHSPFVPMEKGGCVSPPSPASVAYDAMRVASGSYMCAKHGNEIGPLRECAGCVADNSNKIVAQMIATETRVLEEYPMAQMDNVGKTIGELDWQAERSHPSVKGTVTRNDILAWHRQICEEARDLAVRKNRDYAADADPLRNFRLSSQTAGISMSQCALVYLGENVAKYRSFIENGGRSAVKTEKLIDHIRDSINFNILLYAILIDEGYFVHEQKES